MRLRSEVELRVERLQQEHDQTVKELKNKLVKTELELEKESARSKEISIHVNVRTRLALLKV